MPDKKIDELYSILLAQFLTVDKNIFIGKQKYLNKNLYLKDIKPNISYGYYHIDIKQNIKGARYSSVSKYIEINTNLKKITDACPPDYNVTLKNGKNYELKKFHIVDLNSLDSNTIPTEYIVDLSIEDINNLYNTDILDYIKNNLPKVIYWKYEEKYLLPAKINKNDFINNPDCCIPLKNMFELAGFTSIKETFEQANNTSRGVRNLLNKVAKNATSHFRSTWKEYKQVEFEIVENGDFLEPGIKELNAFEMEQRSDGFKRFVTFLLMVSINVKTEKLMGALILVDEPEISLHPSGARFLRDELLNIAKNNYVVYSTHSPFMIDKNNIARHYKVIKKDEKTIVKETTQSDYTEEEVLLNALGTSLFEGLHEQNLLFEGWRDKKIFNVAISKIPSKYSHLKEKLNNIGACHSKGVKDIKNIVPLIELANKKCLIVSDADKPAKENQKIFKEKGYYGIWKRYDEIYNDNVIITGEDFIKSSAFDKILKEIAKTNNIEEFDNNNFEHSNKGKIEGITTWLRKNSVENISEILNEIKDYIFSNLKYSQIEEYYYDFLEKLMNELN